MAREAIQYFSEQWYRYPYPQATTVEGPIEGMEYPMLTFVREQPEPGGAAVGAGPRVRPRVVPDGRRLQRAALSLDGRGVQHLHRSGRRGPLLRRARLRRLDRGPPAASLSGPRDPGTGAAADQPSGGGERPLLDRLPEARAHDADAALRGARARNGSTHAFREYIRTWAFKHPTPADFFRLMRDASGMDLDWFWRDWIYTTARLDQAVDSVGSRKARRCIWPTAGRMTLPLEMELDLHRRLDRAGPAAGRDVEPGTALRLSDPGGKAGAAGGGGSAAGRCPTWIGATTSGRRWSAAARGAPAAGR